MGLSGFKQQVKSARFTPTDLRHTRIAHRYFISMRYWWSDALSSVATDKWKVVLEELKMVNVTAVICV